MTSAQRRRERAKLRGRVACLAQRSEPSAERDAALRWLGGLRRLDALVLPIGTKR